MVMRAYGRLTVASKRFQAGMIQARNGPPFILASQADLAGLPTIARWHNCWLKKVNKPLHKSDVIVRLKVIKIIHKQLNRAICILFTYLLSICTSCEDPRFLSRSWEFIQLFIWTSEIFSNESCLLHIRLTFRKSNLPCVDGMRLFSCKMYS